MKFAAYEPDRPASATERVDPHCVRPATHADIDAIARISAERQGTEPEDGYERIAHEIDSFEAGGQWAVFVAEVESQVVGYGRVRHTGPDPEDDPPIPEGWHLVGVVVSPQARRRGIAHALIATRLDWLRERADETWYFVNRRNRASIALHDAFGFELVGPVAHKRAELSAEDGLLFRLRLAALDAPGA
jgi:ribosomal protein S18 acetylase RimI-like enzyme